MTSKPLPPTLDHTYETTHGQAGEYLAADGTHIRLQPGQERVVVGWTTTRRVADVADVLSAFATARAEVYVCSPTAVRKPKARGAALTSLLVQHEEIELVRIERGKDALVWDASHEPTDKSPDVVSAELSVIAADWSRAAEVASSVGAQAVADALPLLVEDLAARHEP